MQESSKHACEEEAFEPLAETDWEYLRSMTDEEAHANALADPDNPPLTKEQLSRMRHVPNPLEIRERLGLTRREFTKQFEISLDNVRDWEDGVRRPDSTAKAYLRVIERNPDAVREALAQTYENPASEPSRLAG